MDHRVRFVDDDLMPEGRLWLMCERDDVTTLFLSRSATQMTDREKEIALEETWTAFLDLIASKLPTQRVAS